jgi:hypothetical protein
MRIDVKPGKLEGKIFPFDNAKQAVVFTGDIGVKLIYARIKPG